MSTHNICFYKPVVVIQMSTHNIPVCFCKKPRTPITLASLNMPTEKSFANIRSRCALIRKVFYYGFFRNFERLKRTVW